MIGVSETRFNALAAALGMADEKSSDAVIAQAIDRLNPKWLCFHCGFQTDKEAEAQAHFGDFEEAVSVCLDWDKLNADGKVAEYQNTLAELNASREYSDDLRRENENLEYRIGSQESEIKAHKPFRNCRSINDIFNVYDSMEGRALAAEERLTKWETFDGYIKAGIKLGRNHGDILKSMLSKIEEINKDIIPGSLQPLADKISNLENELKLWILLSANAAAQIEQQRSQEAVQRDLIARMAPKLYEALEALQTVAEGLQTMAHQSHRDENAANICPGCTQAYQSPTDGCLLCSDKKKEIQQKAVDQMSLTDLAERWPPSKEGNNV